EFRSLSSHPTRRCRDATTKSLPTNLSARPLPQRIRKLSSGHARVASREPFADRLLNRASEGVAAGADPRHAFGARIYRLTRDLVELRSRSFSECPTRC